MLEDQTLLRDLLRQNRIYIKVSQISLDHEHKLMGTIVLKFKQKAGLITFFITLFISMAPALPAEALPPFTLPPAPEIRKLKSAVLETNKGKLYLELFPETAPWHVANFKYLADKGFYNGLRFHIFEPGYVIQTGAPGKSIASGPGYSIPPEFSDVKHKIGILSMVRKPNDLDLTHARRSHGSQFRILLRSARHMDGTHTIFGQVKKGFQVLRKLRKNDKIIKLTVFVRDPAHSNGSSQ